MINITEKATQGGKGFFHLTLPGMFLIEESLDRSSRQAKAENTVYWLVFLYYSEPGEAQLRVGLTLLHQSLIKQRPTDSTNH